MKKILAILVVMCFAATMSFAINPNYSSTVDVLGAHNNHGRGCVGCHAPHSGPAGNGETLNGTVTGDTALWGESFGTLAGTTLSFGGGSYKETLPANDQATTPDLSGLMFCLSCHDGNLAVGAMLKNQVAWTAEGLNPTALGYASANVPTELGNDGSTVGNYSNDHPAGLNANLPTWTGETVTITASGSSYKVAVSATATPATQFAANYGFTASPASANGTTAVVLCTTCHNQHVMTVYKGTIGGVGGYYQTQFGIRGYYNPGTDGSNSVAQFCRQCHSSEGNESNNTFSIPTV